MTVKTTELYNGRLRLHSLYTDKFKMSRFSINFITESDKYRTPLHKLALSVMMRGSQKYPTVTDINRALDERYGTTVSYRSTRVGDKSIYKLSCKLLKQEYVFGGDSTDILGEVMEILSDILFCPVKGEDGLFLPSYVESEKRIAIDAVNAKINDPKAYASEQCSRYMFDGSKYELYGDDTELISSFSARELTESMPEFFRTCRIECFYIGNEPCERVTALIEKNFKFDTAPNTIPQYCESAFDGAGGEVKRIEEEKNVSEGRLVLGYRCGTVLSDSDYYAMALFNEIFGGGSVSKLFMNVREKKSLCYYCYSSLHSATGTIKVGCGIAPSKKDEAMQEIARQLDTMKNGDFTDSELDTARSSILSGIRQINDSPSSIEAYFLRRLLASVNESPEDCCERISTVTREDIVKAAGKVVLDTVYFMNGCGEDGENE